MKVNYVLLCCAMIMLGCSNKGQPTADYKITPLRIGNLHLYDSYEHLEKLSDVQIDSVTQHTEYGVFELVKYAILDEYGNELAFCSRKKEGSAASPIRKITCVSDRFSTENQIRVGMKINELRQKYPELGYELEGAGKPGQGYYCPTDLVAKKAIMPVSHLCILLKTMNTQSDSDTVVTAIFIEID